MFVSWVLFVFVFRSLVFMLEVRGVFYRVVGIEGDCVFISWLWRGECFVESFEDGKEIS